MTENHPEVATHNIIHPEPNEIIIPTDGINTEAIKDFPEKHRSRNYCFTLNNWTEKERNSLIENQEQGKYKYICWGYEYAETGTQHLQGYVELKEGKPFTTLKKDKGFNRASFFPRAPKSNKIKAVTYCAKNLGKQIYIEIEGEKLKKELNDGTINQLKFDTELETLNHISESKILYWMRTDKGLATWRKYFTKNRNTPQGESLFYESGDWKYGLKPGQRTDIDNIKNIINKGGNMSDVIENATSHQSVKFAEMMFKYKDLQPRESRPYVIWLYGKSGAGKTSFFNKYVGGRYWKSSSDLTFFDGYDGHENVILNEIRNSSFGRWGFRFFLEILDRHPLKVPIKGGFVEWKPKLIIITSLQHPFVEIPTEPGDDNHTQLSRRIDKILLIEKDPNDEFPPESNNYIQLKNKFDSLIPTNKYIKEDINRNTPNDDENILYVNSLTPTYSGICKTIIKKR